MIGGGKALLLPGSVLCVAHHSRVHRILHVAAQETIAGIIRFQPRRLFAASVRLPILYGFSKRLSMETQSKKEL